MASERSKIFLLSLGFRSFLDDTYSSLIDSLVKPEKLKLAKSSPGAIQYLEAHNPNTILVTDECLMETTNGAMLVKMQFYIKNGCLFILSYKMCHKSQITSHPSSEAV